MSAQLPVGTFVLDAGIIAVVVNSRKATCTLIYMDGAEQELCSIGSTRWENVTEVTGKVSDRHRLIGVAAVRARQREQRRPRTTFRSMYD